MNAPIFPLAYGNTLSLGESIQFQILGALVVFSALGFLWGALELSGYFFRRSEIKKRAAQLSSRAGEATAPIPVPPPRIPAEVLAALAAAVHVTFKERVRILSISPARPPETISQLSLHAWSVEGRRQIFDSRRVR